MGRELVDLFIYNKKLAASILENKTAFPYLLFDAHEEDGAHCYSFFKIPVSSPSHLFRMERLMDKHVVMDNLKGVDFERETHEDLLSRLSFTAGYAVMHSETGKYKALKLTELEEWSKIKNQLELM